MSIEILQRQDESGDGHRVCRRHNEGAGRASLFFARLLARAVSGESRKALELSDRGLRR